MAAMIGRVDRVAAGACLAAIMMAVSPPAVALPSRADQSNALWQVVHRLCVTDMRINRRPAPCTMVDLAQRFAVVRDIDSATQFLLVPIDRITGVEDPGLLAPSSPNYWRYAWDAREFLEKRLRELS